MKRLLLAISIFTSYHLILLACNQPKPEKLSQEEIQILAANFQRVLKNYYIAYYNQYIDSSAIHLLGIIDNDVEEHQCIQTSRTTIVNFTNNFIGDLMDYHKDRHASYLNYISTRIDSFENQQFSLIKDYAFVDAVLSLIYDVNWKCMMNIGADAIVHSLDTMNLYESENYQIPISVDIEDNKTNPWVITSNSLQKEDPYQINFKTDSYKEGVFKKVFKYTLESRIMNKHVRMKDSIFYRLIKK